MLKFLQNEFEKFILFRYLSIEREFGTSQVGLIALGEGS
jgi:hypothetical protein